MESSRSHNYLLSVRIQTQDNPTLNLELPLQDYTILPLKKCWIKLESNISVCFFLLEFPRLDLNLCQVR